MINGLICKARIPRPFQHTAMCSVPLEIRSVRDGQILPRDSCVVTKNPSAKLLMELYAIRERVLCVCAGKIRVLWFIGPEQ